MVSCLFHKIKVVGCVTADCEELHSVTLCDTLAPGALVVLHKNANLHAAKGDFAECAMRLNRLNNVPQFGLLPAFQV